MIQGEINKLLLSQAIKKRKWKQTSLHYPLEETVWKTYFFYL